MSGKYVLGVAQTTYINIPKYIGVIYSLLEGILIKKYTDIFRSKVAIRAKGHRTNLLNDDSRKMHTYIHMHYK